MKLPRHLSPSSITVYKRNPREFYLRYLADNRPERTPGTNAMSVGIAFDCRIKSQLSLAFYGKDNFVGEAKNQINPEHYEMAHAAGEHIFAEYVESGAFGALLDLVSESPLEPIMEEDVECKIGEATLFGKPDLAIATKNHIPIMADFKVNGYCSKYPKSPQKGWMKLRSRVGEDWETRNYHPKTVPLLVDGVEVNATWTMDQVYVDWAAQLTVYGWALEKMGVTSNVDPITMIEQIVAKPNKQGGKPILRFATHSAFVAPSFKLELYEYIQKLWALCHSDHFFTDVSKEESQFLQHVLDETSANTSYHGVMDLDDDTEITFANAFTPLA